MYKQCSPEGTHNGVYQGPVTSELIFPLILPSQAAVMTETVLEILPKYGAISYHFVGHKKEMTILMIEFLRKTQVFAISQEIDQNIVGSDKISNLG